MLERMTEKVLTRHIEWFDTMRIKRSPIEVDSACNDLAQVSSDISRKRRSGGIIEARLMLTQCG